MINKDDQYSWLMEVPITVVYAATALDHFWLTRPRVNWYQPMLWNCSEYAGVRSISGPRSVPIVGAWERRESGVEWSHSENPCMIVLVASTEVEICLRRVSSSMRHWSRLAAVAGKGHFRTCSNVSSDVFQPGHKLDDPWYRWFCQLVLARLRMSFDMLNFWWLVRQLEAISKKNDHVALNYLFHLFNASGFFYIQTHLVANFGCHFSTVLLYPFAHIFFRQQQCKHNGLATTIRQHYKWSESM